MMTLPSIMRRAASTQNRMALNGSPAIAPGGPREWARAFIFGCLQLPLQGGSGWQTAQCCGGPGGRSGAAMSPSGDQLVTRISGGASSQSGPGPLGGLPGVQSPYGAGAALRGGAGGDAGEMMMNPYPGAGLMAKLNEDFNVWLMTGGANRLMGARPAAPPGLVRACVRRACVRRACVRACVRLEGAWLHPVPSS